MIHFERFTLANGLTVIVHEDHTTPMAVLNIMYDVGARDEHPGQTGFAHLFEHLMFGGSVNIPNYDGPLQEVGGENNAFTNNDITNYYIQVPSANLETAFWLESDRILSLAFSEKSLDVQRNVVIEEFKQRYLNQPYGDVWLKLRPLAYTTHPYKWATIGEKIEHVADAKMENVKDFFQRFYHPANAVLVVAGDVYPEQVKELAEKWFGTLPAREKQKRDLPAEPAQTAKRELRAEANVPMKALYMAFHIPGRTEQAYYAADVLSDILSRGQSSRLYRRLVKDNPVFVDLNAYLTSSVDPGLMIVDGKIGGETGIEEAEAMVWRELIALAEEPVSERELEKVKNKIESTLIFTEMDLLDRAVNLAFFELMGDASLVNEEAARYRKVTAADVQNAAKQIFRSENLSVLYYEPLTAGAEADPA
ncbi:MAG: insulinase family protein [Mucilaginibacter polytrichastri]|nr:insulinase family protein [Mucilaginibacter polytrichastri]